MSGRVRKVMTQPINLIFRFLQNVRARVVRLGRVNHRLGAGHGHAVASLHAPAQRVRCMWWLGVRCRIACRPASWGTAVTLWCCCQLWRHGSAVVHAIMAHRACLCASAVCRKLASRSGCTNRPASGWRAASSYVHGVVATVVVRACSVRLLFTRWQRSCTLPTSARLTLRSRPHWPPVWQGFDEYMNLVLDAAEEVDMKKGSRKALGRILLKGDNITLMAAAAGAEKK